MQRSSNSDVAAWFISRKVLGIRGKKGECESPTDDMVRISCSHLLGSLVICWITKYQPDKPPPDWSSLWLGHLSFLLFRSTELKIQWLSAFSQELFRPFLTGQ